jgi:hypothetical protein
MAKSKLFTHVPAQTSNFQGEKNALFPVFCYQPLTFAAQNLPVARSSLTSIL